MMSIKQEMINGVLWGAVQKYSGLFIQILITAVLARLLSPEDFGVIAVVTVLIAFFTLFTDMGIGPAIIQSQLLTKNDLDSIFSFTILGGIILSLLFFGAAYPIASFYQDESLVLICQILSVNLLFSSWNIVPNALINKNKRFKFIAKRTLGLQIISGCISIFVAYHGFGVYSLLISPVFTGIGVFILNYRQYPFCLYLSIDLQSLKKISSYSVYQFLFNIVNFFSRNLDKLLVGRCFSMNELGYYEKSYRLMLLPMNNITNVITPVMHPVLTSIQGDYVGLTEKYNKIIKLLATISFPLGVFLYFAADSIILIVYGDQWAAAIPVFQILALSLSLQMILSTTGAIYQVAGKTNWLFYGGVSNSCCTVSGFIIASIFFRTIEAMAWAWNITLFTNALVSYFILYRIVLKQSVVKMLKQCIIPMFISLALAVVLKGYIYICDPTLPFLSLISLSILSLILTLTLIQLTHHYDLFRFWMIIKNQLANR